MASKFSKGDRYEVKSSFVAGVLTMWKAPFTGGYERTIPAGLRFTVALDASPSASAISADVDDIEFENILVEPSDRSNPKYNGYYLVIGFEKIQTHCVRIF